MAGLLEIVPAWPGLGSVSYGWVFGDRVSMAKLGEYQQWLVFWRSCRHDRAWRVPVMAGFFGDRAGMDWLGKYQQWSEFLEIVPTWLGLASTSDGRVFWRSC